MLKITPVAAAFAPIQPAADATILTPAATKLPAADLFAGYKSVYQRIYPLVNRNNCRAVVLNKEHEPIVFPARLKSSAAAGA